MKATGAEIWAFWQAWPLGDDWYIDGYSIDIEAEGVCTLAPATKYDLDDFGVFEWQGQTTRDGHPAPKGFASEFARWKKAQITATVVVTLPKAQTDEFKALCKQRGWKVM